MEGESVGHNFERNPPKNHPCHVWFNLVHGFQRRRFKCESLRRTTDGRTDDDGRRTSSDGKSSHALWQGELKTLSKRKFYALTLYMGAAINRLVSYVKNTGSVQEPVLVTAYNLKSNVLL